jgi:hypothetical protein
MRQGYTSAHHRGTTAVSFTKPPTPVDKQARLVSFINNGSLKIALRFGNETRAKPGSTKGVDFSTANSGLSKCKSALFN